MQQLERASGSGPPFVWRMKAPLNWAESGVTVSSSTTDLVGMTTAVTLS